MLFRWVTNLVLLLLINSTVDTFLHSENSTPPFPSALPLSVKKVLSRARVPADDWKGGKGGLTREHEFSACSPV